MGVDEAREGETEEDEGDEEGGGREEGEGRKVDSPEIDDLPRSLENWA